MRLPIVAAAIIVPGLAIAADSNTTITADKAESMQVETDAGTGVEAGAAADVTRTADEAGAQAQQAGGDAAADLDLDVDAETGEPNVTVASDKAESLEIDGESGGVEAGAAADVTQTADEAGAAAQGAGDDGAVMDANLDIDAETGEPNTTVASDKAESLQVEVDEQANVEAGAAADVTTTADEAGAMAADDDAEVGELNASQIEVGKPNEADDAATRTQ